MLGKQWKAATIRHRERYFPHMTSRASPLLLSSLIIVFIIIFLIVLVATRSRHRSHHPSLINIIATNTIIIDNIIIILITDIIITMIIATIGIMLVNIAQSSSSSSSHPCRHHNHANWQKSFGSIIHQLRSIIRCYISAIIHSDFGSSAANYNHEVFPCS